MAGDDRLSAAVRTPVEINALLPAVIQSVPSALMVIDADFRVVMANPAAATVLGEPQTSLVDSSLARFFSLEALQYALEHLRTLPGPFKYNERVRRAEGEHELEVSVELLVSADGEYLCLCLSDAPPTPEEQTGRGRALDASVTYFEQAHQLEALRHVTSTFAHDFNNLLSVVLASLESAARRVKRAECPREDIERAFIATERNVHLTAQILEYAKREETKVEFLTPSTQILALRGLIELLLGDKIELIVRAQSSQEVCISASRLETAVLNLVINSRDAIVGRGVIEIAVDPRRVRETEASALQVYSGEYVVVGVRDDGCGMSEDVRRRAVEPFFTTKSAGRGTGLGLSSVSGIMRAAGGCLHIASSEPHGTLVELYFPITIKN